VSTGHWVEVEDGSPFPVENLPFGIGAIGPSGPRAFVAIGDHALNLGVLAEAGLLDGCGAPEGCFLEPNLNRFVAAGRAVASAARERLQELLGDPATVPPPEAVVERSSLRMGVPVAVGDYVDFYSSLHHARNLGRLFRPDSEPLLPNWRHLPVGYHGRAGTIVVSGTDVRRPSGLRLVGGSPSFGPTAALDIELEVGFVIGAASTRGVPVPAPTAGDHIFGFCLVNDWSARDIQAFEYQPLGPFLGKSFATSISPWLVTLDALEPHRVVPPPQDPPVAGYLRDDRPWGLAIELEVLLQSQAMRSAGADPLVVTRTRFDDMYWTPAQQLAHATVNGASIRPGDLFASGTVSGPDRGSEGSLIELTWRGERPIELPDGTTRAFLEDGDRVILRGWAAGEGATRIGLGEVSGTVVPASGE
jgi:fumarylacetoacetase